MKKNLFLFFLILSAPLFSQESPRVILNDSSQLKIKSLSIDVQIIGNTATTTYDMKFYNELNRTLEGELAFPLAEGQSVSRFAMEVNGKLREAVVVEKELARVAYETTIRQKIDPGLLEKTQGNNYKARIYPILPNSEKHIVITYEQELFTSNGLQVYELPLGIKETLDDFSVKINLLEEKNTPSIKNNTFENFLFKSTGSGYEASLKLKKYSPESPITVQIKNPVTTEKTIIQDDYFYIYKTFKPNSRIKEKPKSITLLWDVSYSTKNRKLEEEINLLENYFGYLKNVEVQFVSFSNSVIQNKTFTIEDGNWESLKKLLENSKYDGGTSFNLFYALKKTDETLLFTDGMHNLGKYSFFDQSPVYIVNSVVSSDHESLTNLATKTGGNYINLNRLSFVAALDILKKETFQFLGVAENSNIYEVYPEKNTSVSTDFSLTGKFKNNTSIVLQFGYRGKITETHKFNITKTRHSQKISRIWAKQKLQYLNENKEKNKDEIISLGKKHQLITDYTSLLILDRVEDYVRYRIEPPKDLKSEYKRLLDDVEKEEMNNLEFINERKEELKFNYEEIIDWYNKKFPDKISKKEEPTGTQERRSNSGDERPIQQNSNNNQTIRANVNTQNIDLNKRIVSGNVVDDIGLPLPGVNIVIKGTSTGTQTDFDGNFSLNAEAGQELVFSYVGFNSTTVRVTTTNSINITLEPSASQLDHVVVTAYSSQRRSRQSMEYSFSVTESLSGRASGINIVPVESDFKGSYTEHLSPLYILNGEIVPQNPITSTHSNEIETIEFIEATNAIKIYGPEASNGLLVITTKEGKKENKDKIEALEKKINEKIELKSWDPDTPYLKILNQESTIENAYNKYLDIREEYANIPSFYLDVSDFFYSKNDTNKAITVVTNLIEIDLDNYELLRALAYKLEASSEYSLAVMVYEKVLTLRPEDPQSYRDLALAYQEVGEFQKSFDILYKIYNGELIEKDLDGRYEGIEEIIFIELCRLVSLHEKEIKISKKLKKQFYNLPLDIRIVIDWNHNETDIDLWVIDPNQEKAFYSNSLTKIGGRMSKDMTEGFGPEEFTLNKAVKGDYEIYIDYFADNVQKISGPTILKVTIYQNYGKKNEVKNTKVYRLDSEDDELEIGKITF